MADVKKIVGIGIALAVAFVMLGSIIMPFFSSSYRYCQDPAWAKRDTGLTNCTYDETGNTTAMPELASTGKGGLRILGTYGNESAAWCGKCVTKGDYYTVNQGMTLIVFILAIVGFAIYFLPKARR